MSEPKFKRGDVVQYKASKERAVVLYHLVSCVNPEHKDSPLIHFSGFKDDCVLKFSGSYRLDPGFTVEEIEYHEDMLELV